MCLCARVWTHCYILSFGPVQAGACLGAAHGVGTNSGTSALHIALVALGVPQTLLGAVDATTLEGAKQAISIGPVAIASVVVSQGGTMAALLGLVFLRERLSRVQLAGVALTCVAVALLATG